MVVYDQNTKDAGQLSKDGFVHILLSKLDGTFHKVSLLTGKNGEVQGFIIYQYLSCLYYLTDNSMEPLYQQRVLPA